MAPPTIDRLCMSPLYPLPLSLTKWTFDRRFVFAKPAVRSAATEGRLCCGKRTGRPGEPLVIFPVRSASPTFTSGLMRQPSFKPLELL